MELKFINSTLFRSLLVLAAVLSDQVTKWWAKAKFSLPDGEPDYFMVQSVFGEWLQFRLVYNSGAAFGLKPQALIPFLHPTLFYLIISIVAIAVLTLYYRKVPANDVGTKTGIVLILAGAFGNLFDRLQFHKVTDFIDVGIPGISSRWPTFNLADSWVCIGVGMILILPMFNRSQAGQIESQATGGAGIPATSQSDISA